MGLIKLRAGPRATDPALIFVHGILSSAEDCWRNGNRVSWPAIVMRDPDFPPCGVSTFSYASTVADSRFSITDAADSLWDQLQGANMLGSGRLPIFVCHSMGGIVVRKLLVKRQVELKRLGMGLVGLFLLASPTMGSRWATWLLPVSFFMRHVQAMALSSRENNLWLHELRDEFINLRDTGDIRVHGKELIEADPIVVKISWLPPIVRSVEGGVLFGNKLKIANTNHFTIAKPVHERADQHIALRNFVIETRQRASGSNYTIPAGTTFVQAAQLVARSRRWDVEMAAFTQAERETASTLERLVTGASTEEALENLGAAFPAGTIRPFDVTVQESTVLLSPRKAIP